jgi:8-oxo-dGTP pyrophosphatase MutT (NUDIX family)
VSNVPVHDAATVVLLRDGAAGVEAWLLTRVPRMAFASGMTVFPGGRVDEADEGLPWAGSPSPQAEFGRAHFGAAVREVFEETGVLLTVPAASLASAQPDVEAGRLQFGDLLREHGLCIDADAVRPWSRWITPAGESRRYDTRFFVAALPEGAQAADLTTESVVAAWIRPADAVEQSARGERKMLPPTLVTLESIRSFGTVAEVLAAAAARSLEPTRPVLRKTDLGLEAQMPDGTTFTLPR